MVFIHFQSYNKMVQKWSKIRYRPAWKRETVCSSRFDPRKRRRHSVEQILNPLQSLIVFFSLSLCVLACVRAVCVCFERVSTSTSKSLSLSLRALYRLRLSPSSVVDDDEEVSVPSNSSKT